MVSITFGNVSHIVTEGIVTNSRNKPPSDVKLASLFFLPSSLLTSLEGNCHGLLHAAGIRRFADLVFTTSEELKAMEFKPLDESGLTKIVRELKRATRPSSSKLPAVAINKSHDISSPGAFEVPYCKQDFQLHALDVERSIFKGRLFNVEQCQLVNRAAESYAYKTTGWRPEIYTLTNLDLHVSASSCSAAPI